MTTDVSSPWAAEADLIELGLRVLTCLVREAHLPRTTIIALLYAANPSAGDACADGTGEVAGK